MSFDKPTRNLLAKMTAAVRNRLAEDITAQLQSTYGLYPDGSRLDVAQTPEDRHAAVELRALLDHFESAEPEGKTRQANAYQRLVREIGFTLLNRLAALRLCEERGLVIECVRSGMNSAGFQLYDRLAGGALGNRFQTYRAFLSGMFDELAADLGALFDRRTPQSVVFPSEPALNDVLALLNDAELANRKIWQQDETIGWIYQYYNDPAERKKMRGESQAPRNSRELAVRNQFFTPRYVVEFLTDNTLGRTWYEMTQGETKLVEQCCYLVRRPNEVWLKEGEEANTAPSDENQTQEELLQAPEYILFREKKDPRRLRVLDPACGSGHFLLYAFDLLETIYAEAYDDPNLGPDLHDSFPDRVDYLRQAPRLILENNLHGIDIDPRAAQIAALALWLRAQRAWQSQKLNSSERPRVGGTHIVVAEPMPGDEGMLEEFIADLPKDQHPEIIGPLVRTVFEKMKLAGEAGSLLKIEEELNETVEQARTAWSKTPQPEQLSFLPGQPKPRQLGLDLSRMTDESFWKEAVGLVLDAMEDYARQSENGKGLRRRLFAGDAAQGFAFIDLCRKRFDVILMNPPFGEPSQKTRQMVTDKYEKTKQDLFATFCERAIDLLLQNGLLGEISSRVGFFIKSFVDWRRKVLSSVHLDTVIDLGFGVLDDATVEAASYIICKKVTNNEPKTVFVRLLLDVDKDEQLLFVLQSATKDSRYYKVQLSKYYNIPLSPFIYWVSIRTLQKITSHPTLEPAFAIVRQGLGTGDNNRFIRLAWEVPVSHIGADSVKTPEQAREQFSIGKRWAYHVRAGYSQPWYSPITLVIDWENQGLRFKEYWLSKGETPSRYIPSENLYFHPGFSWTQRAFRFIPYIIPIGCIPSASRYMTFPNEGKENITLGLCASNISTAFSRFYGEMFERPKHLVDTVKRFPFIQLSKEVEQQLKETISKEVISRRNFYKNVEPFIEFTLPYLIKRWSDLEVSNWNPYTLVGTSLENEIAKAYELSPNQLTELEFDLFEAIKARSNNQDNQKNVDISGEDDDNLDLKSDISPKGLHADLLSYLFGCVVCRWDVRFAMFNDLAPDLPSDPFSPLPICSPGMLVDTKGLPAKSSGIASNEWLITRKAVDYIPSINANGNFMANDGNIYSATTSDSEYPLPIPWDGILVDDPGLGEHPESHEKDILRGLERTLQLLWPENHEYITAEACQILGVKDLREYFRKASGFFTDHLKRYSKSRRQAPIYWPLSTPSGSYTLWIYYHRLTGETLYTANLRYLTPKIEQVERYLSKTESDLAEAFGRSASEMRDKVDATRAFLAELNEFRAELLRVANLPYQPDLNDGVIINAAPLYKLFRLGKWSKDCQAVWEKLEAGEYDWALMAYVLWPGRVREKCKSDKSLAIAHGLEELYQG